MHVSRRLLLGITGVLATLLTIAPLAGLRAAEADEDASAAVPVVHLDGRGYGHGVGLSQWGAYTMALDGADAATILGQFYPGTSIEPGGGEVVVVVDTRDRLRVRLPSGGELRSSRAGAQSEGFPVRVQPGDVVEIVHDGHGYRVVSGGVRGADTGDRQRFRAAGEDCLLLCQPDPGSDPEPAPGPCVDCSTSTTTTTTTTPPPTAPGAGQPAPGPQPTEPPPSTAPSGDPVSPTPIWAIPDGGGPVEAVDRGRAYRGLFEVTGGPGALRLRNHVDVEDYLKGMGEVPSTWPAAAVQAQAVAARTYALRAMAAGGELCDTASCQVYIGIQGERPGQIAAVDATRGWTVTYGHRLAATFYSASGGGHSATLREGFGATYEVPYLQARPYKTANPKVWALDIALSDVGARLGYPGHVTDVRIVETGPSGRPIAMQLDGDAGVADVDPQEFRRSLGLQSNMFTTTVDQTTHAPPPPPAPIEDQLTTAPGAAEDQFAAIGGPQTLAAISEQAAPEPTSFPPAQPPGNPAPGIALAVVALAALGVTAPRLWALGAATAADGLGDRVLGAPMRGWPRSAAFLPRAATMSRWRNRYR